MKIRYRDYEIELRRTPMTKGPGDERYAVAFIGFPLTREGAVAADDFMEWIEKAMRKQFNDEMAGPGLNG